MTQTHTNGNGKRASVAPSDLEAEEGALGAMMMHALAWQDVFDVLEAGDFYDPRNAAIFSAIEKLVGVDPFLVAAQLAADGDLDAVGGRARVVQLAANSPVTGNAVHYAGLVAERSADRRAIMVGEELSQAGRESDVEAVEQLLAAGSDRVFGNVMQHREWEPAKTFEDLVAGIDVPVREWIVEDLLDRGEWVIFTGGEGHGKTTLIRQLGVQIASGIHPFTLASTAPRRVLHVDLQETERQSNHEYVKLIDVAGDRFVVENLRVVHRTRMNLLDRWDRRAFEKEIQRTRADVVSFGPIYQAYQVPPGRFAYDEEVAEHVARVLDEIADTYGIAWLIEAHSPHGVGQDRAGLRPIGASLWMRRPDFGFGLAPRKAEKGTARQRPGVDLVRWRGPRDRSRPWPYSLDFGREGDWPFRAPDEEVL